MSSPMATTELKARIEEIEALANHVPPELLAQKSLCDILKIWPNPTADPLPVESIRQRLAEWQTNLTEPELDIESIRYEQEQHEPVPEIVESVKLETMPERLPEEPSEEAQEEPPEKPRKKEPSPEKPRPRGRPVTVRRDQNGKECTKCGEWKPRKDFHKRSDTSDGRSSHCKDCRKLPANGSAERYCAKGSECLAAEETGGVYAHPAILAASSSSPLCERCQRRAGLAS